MTNYEYRAIKRLAQIERHLSACRNRYNAFRNDSEISESLQTHILQQYDDAVEARFQARHTVEVLIQEHEANNPDTEE